MPFRIPAHILTAAAIVLACLTPAAASAQDAATDSPDIIVRVVEADPPAGTLEISLFASTEDFLKQPYLQTSGPVNEDGTYLARFGGVPPGEYAVVVVHDANDNGRLDNGFLGFGGESYAYSNDARRLFGRPDFDQAKFAVTTDTRIEITLE